MVNSTSYFRSLTLLTILVCFCISSCKKPQVDDRNNTALDQVVLIIDKCPNYSSTENPETGVYSSTADDFEITAINSELWKLSYKTKQIPTLDTVVFQTKGEFLELDHIYKFYRHLSFIVQKGDTVLFTYDQDFPKAEILNREVSYEELNYDFIRSNYLLDDFKALDGNSKFNVSPVSSVKGYITIRDPLKQKDIRSKIYQDALEEGRSQLEREILLLDSLVSQGLMGEDAKSLYLKRASVLNQFNEYRYNEYLRENFGGSENTLVEWDIQSTSEVDLASFGYYNKILDYIERKTYYSRVGWIEEVNRRYPDYRRVYDSLKTNEFLAKREIDRLLTKNIELIIEHFPQKDSESYLKKFAEDVSNPLLVQNVLNKHRYALSAEIKEWGRRNFAPVSLSDSLLQLSLINTSNEQFDFNKLLEKHRGRLVYVDFWASHCFPCYAAMPYSKDLASTYKDQAISFIYISIDIEYERWLWGMDKAEISSYPNSFMVNKEGAKNSLLAQLEINEIPRYLLFNKKGELVQYRAFGPKTSEIREVFDTYLN